MSGLSGFFLAIVARAWLATLRLRVVAAPELDDVDAPWVLCFFHGTQFPLLAWKRRRATAVMVSLSRDGAMQAKAMETLGMRVVRGSSSRGGARGLAAVVREMKKGADAAFAIDGPRGPYGEAKPGALLAARAAKGVLVPMGSASARAHVFARAWDRFVLAWPFSRVVVVLGAPLAEDATTLELAAAVARANDEAEGNLADAARNMVPWLGFSRPSAAKPAK